MARKVSWADSAKQPEKREFFNSKYSLKNVTGMKKVGDEAFVLLLKPEEYLFQVEYHTVKEKEHGKVGFKGIFDTKILCKRYDADGNKSEEVPTCCFYADKLFKEAKERAKEEAIKLGKDPEDPKNLAINAPMTFTGAQMYIPLIVLGNKESESGAKPTPSKLAISDGRRMFAYLEMNKKSYITDIYDSLKQQLCNNGEIDSDLSEEELAGIMLQKFKTHIIKVTAKEAKSPKIAYERSYSFIPFSNKNIGNKSGEYEAIVNYEKDEDLMNDATEFLALFETEVDNFVKDWTDDELIKYLVEDETRRQNIEEFKKNETKKEEVEEIKLKSTVETKTKSTANVEQTKQAEAINNIMNQSIEQVSEIEITDEDLSFDDIEDDFVDDEE